MPKLTPLNEIRSKLPDDAVIVQAHGTFDPLHAGHISHLQEAKAEGDILVVTVTSDKYVTKQKGPMRPVRDEKTRANDLAALECVDYVAINHHDTAIEAIWKIKPDLYVKGAEYQKEEYKLPDDKALLEEKAAVEENSGRVVFIDTPAMSSSALLNKHGGQYSPEAERFLTDFRKKYSLSDITAMIDGLADMNVMVIGEVIIDIYTYCGLMGIAPKTREPAYKHLVDKYGEDHMAGGAMHVANTMAGFCKHVLLVSYTGNKGYTWNQTLQAEYFLKTHKKDNVDLQMWVLNDRPPIIKKRYVEAHFPEQKHRETVFEIVYLDDSPFDPNVRGEICGYIKREAANYDLVVASDFGHGLIDARTAGLIAKHSHYLAVNTQTNESNEGFNRLTEKYPRANYFCVDDVELQLAMHDKHALDCTLLNGAAKLMRTDLACMTRGSRGCMLMTAGSEFADVPVFSGKGVIDRIGAGDSFLSLTAPCAAKKYPADVVGFLGNVIGALSCGVVGNSRTVEKREVLGFVKSLMK
jgi:rfaE bifunctional protein nucleotidyltransferase chain/domain